MWAHCQNWAAPGATWYYDDGYSTSGYVRIKHERDTVINGITCDVLSQIWVRYDSVAMTTVVTHMGDEYTYMSSNVVYRFYPADSTFDVLYDFGAAAGDIWNISYGSSVEVDSTGIAVLNNTSLITVYTDIVSGCFMYPERIIEKLGCTGFMFPIPNCMPAIIGDKLRCYFDDTGWSYQMPGRHSCEYLGESYAKVNEEFFYGPNPTGQYLYFSLPGTFTGPTRVEVYDGMGRLCISSTAQAGNVLDMGSLSHGTYLLRLSSSNNSVIARIVRSGQ